MDALFRPEVLEKRRGRLEGGVSLIQPASFTLATLTIIVFLLSCVVFLALCPYTRKERVSGVIMPDLGIVDVAAPYAGRVTEVLVQNGDMVIVGQPLVRVRMTGGVSGDRERVELLERLAERQQRLLAALQERGAAAPSPAHQADIASLERNVTDLKARLASVRPSPDMEVRATAAGRVTGLTSRPGQVVTMGQGLLALVPAGSRLQAVLQVPVSAIPFVETGQQVHLRYHAFPYEKFGLYDGTVTEVGPAADLIPDGQAGEPSYQVRVTLTSDRIAANGRSFPVQAGMRLDADILVEQRSLLQWLSGPLSSSGNKRS